MGFRGLIIALGCAGSLSAAGTDASVVLTYATSYAPNSSRVECLLDPGCDGWWAPATEDFGVAEGVFVAFKEPVDVGTIRLTFEDAGKWLTPRLGYYVNGSAIGPINFPNSVRGLPGSVFELRQPLRNRVSSFYMAYTGDRSKGAPATAPRLKRVEFLHRGKTLRLGLPRTISATISATTVLEGSQAFIPENLFDSRRDYAWSTDGTKNDGVGESVSIKLATPVDLGGLLVWNGYQRSKVHFQANASVKQLQVKVNGEDGGVVRLEDSLGSQEVGLKKAFQGVRDLGLTVSGVRKGARYKDMLISELRLIDGQDKSIIQPLVVRPPFEYPGPLKPLQGKAWRSCVLGGYGKDCGMNFDRVELRFRDDGSFVVYHHRMSGDRGRKQDILEGSFEVKEGAVSVFGRRYSTYTRDTLYIEQSGGEPIDDDTSIFRTPVEVVRYSDMDQEERHKAFQALGVGKGCEGYQFWFGGDGLDAQSNPVPPSQAAKALDVFLRKTDPYLIKTSFYTGYILPAEEVADVAAFE